MVLGLAVAHPARKSPGRHASAGRAGHGVGLHAAGAAEPLAHARRHQDDAPRASPRVARAASLPVPERTRLDDRRKSSVHEGDPLSQRRRARAGGRRGGQRALRTGIASGTAAQRRSAAGSQPPPPRHFRVDLREHQRRFGAGRPVASPVQRQLAGGDLERDRQPSVQ